MPRALFTPSQANATLPLVRRIVSDVLARGQEIQALTRMDPQLARARIGVVQAQLQDLLAELESIGCSYRDWGFELGLVDFPAEIDGQRVLLCWRSDEPEVRFYHPPDAGFAGRRPIPPHMLGSTR